jgi:UDP-N-acetylmuramyl pentapeptide phosphotransferase/UDP-N-acetylglucosamine-1-phosphate transferase
MFGGPALVAGATAGTLLAKGPVPGTRTAISVALLGAGAAGLYDDLCEHRHAAAKGLRGHLVALGAGRLSSGAVKAAGLAGTGLLVAELTDRPGTEAADGAAQKFLGAALVVGSAHLANLFDLRPGRCLKIGLLVAPAVAGSAVGPALGAAAALLSADLAERVMLGDSGANAFGAALGTATLLRFGRTGRLLTLATVAALIASAERVSFSEVIAAQPLLRRIDECGRRATAT